MSTTTETTNTDFLHSHAAAYAGGDYRADDYADWYVERYGACELEEWDNHPRAWVEFMTKQDSEDDSDDLAADIERDGYSLEAVEAWADLPGHDLTEWDRPTREAFEDSYEGHNDSETEYVRSLAEDLGLLRNVPEEVAAYFDIRSYAQDLFLSGSYTSCDASSGGAFIFSHS